MSMKKLKIKAVGSSMFIAEEIKGICQSLLGETLEIECAASGCVTSFSDNEFYVCANTQKGLLERYIPQEQLFDMELKPTTAFFVDLAGIPENEAVCVFNNLSPYINVLIAEFAEISPHKLNFIPVPYEEMDKVTARELLGKARYIIGVDCFMGERVLLSDEYRTALLPETKLIAGHRTASLNSSYRLLRGIAAYYLEWGRRSISTGKESSLQEISSTLEAVIELIKAGTMKALFNQIGSYEEDGNSKELTTDRQRINLVQQVHDQLRILSFLQEKVGMVTVQ